MAGKSSGLGDRYLSGGYDISGDINSLSKISGGPKLGDGTDITMSANGRLGLTRDGGIDFVTFMDVTAGAGSGAHVPLSALPTADVICSYLRGTAVGNSAASLVAKQVGYDPTRANDGSLTLQVSMQANGYGLEWGEQLTAGLRTDTVATTGTAKDETAATSFGAQAYLHLTALTGTSVDIKVEHSADNTTWATLIDFGSLTAIGAVRGSVSNTTTVDRYVRVTTTGTFTSATFAVNFARNAIAGVSF